MALDLYIYSIQGEHPILTLSLTEFIRELLLQYDEPRKKTEL